jgi:hypothetical protein
VVIFTKRSLVAHTASGCDASFQRAAARSIRHETMIFWNWFALMLFASYW